MFIRIVQDPQRGQIVCSGLSGTTHAANEIAVNASKIGTIHSGRRSLSFDEEISVVYHSHTEKDAAERAIYEGLESGRAVVDISTGIARVVVPGYWRNIEIENGQDTVPTKSVTLSHTKITLAQGQKTKITASITPENA